MLSLFTMHESVRQLVIMSNNHVSFIQASFAAFNIRCSTRISSYVIYIHVSRSILTASICDLYALRVHHTDYLQKLHIIAKQ